MWLIILGATVLVLFVAAGADDARHNRAEPRHPEHARPRTPGQRDGSDR
jgi:hypothetical protein